MKKKLLFICSPGIGILDNALPILYILKEKYEPDIIFLKKDTVKHFAKNPVLGKLSQAILKNSYIKFNEDLVFKLKTTKNVFFYLNPVILFFYSLVGKLFKLNRIINYKDFIANYDLIVFDLYENHKLYFKNLSKYLKKKKINFD